LQGLFYEVPPELEGYHRSLTGWVENFVVETVLVEKDLIDDKRGFRGHPDAIVRLRGDTGLILIDWKTPKPLSLSWRLQLAGYRLLAEANGHKVARVASLRLDADGGSAKFQGYTKTLAHDQNVFLSCLNVWKFFNEGKG
jgi:predicted RecB family nuclease